MGTIEWVPSEERFSRFYSIFFIIQQQMVSIRAILDLKSNKRIKKKFWMEILAFTVSYLSQKGLLDFS